MFLALGVVGDLQPGLAPVFELLLPTIECAGADTVLAAGLHYSRILRSTEYFQLLFQGPFLVFHISNICLLYTSDAADDLLCVDLGGRRIIKKKKKKKKKTNI